MSAKVVNLRIDRSDRPYDVTIMVSQLIIAGWAGRNIEDVNAHIRELEEIGVTPPTEVPTFYRVSRDTLTHQETVDVVGGATSGEIEVVLICDGEDIYVAVGSDHTDRQLEAINVSQSKQICPKPISLNAWLLADVEDHWDMLELESRIGPSFSKIYQSGTVASLRSPRDLLETYRKRGGEMMAGTVMFCGTLSVNGAIALNEALQLRLYDPVARREILHSYNLNVLPALG